MPIRKLKLVKTTQETPEVKTFRFEPLEPFAFKAGQFLMFRLPRADSSKLEVRPYSISTPPSEKRFIEITVRVMEDSYFPKLLASLPVGAVVEADGPLGHFVLSESGLNIVVIGAGVGIAGLRPFWTESLSRNPDAKIIILYSARTRDEIIWKDDYAKLGPSVRTVITLTRERPDDWGGETGRIDATMIKRQVADPETKEYYICGPPEMVVSTKNMLTEMGVPVRQIFMEAWTGISHGS